MKLCQSTKGPITGLVNSRGIQWNSVNQPRGQWQGLSTGMTINENSVNQPRGQWQALLIGMAINENFVNQPMIHWQTFQSGDRAVNDGLDNPIGPKLGLLHQPLQSLFTLIVCQLTFWLGYEQNSSFKNTNFPSWPVSLNWSGQDWWV